MAMIGIATDYRTPGILSQIIFGTGESIAGGGARKLLVIEEMLASGTWTAGVLQTGIKKESEVIAGAGAGSAVHRAWYTASQANRGVDIDILPVAPTTGAGATQAISTFTIAGTATGSGYVQFKIAEELDIRVPFVSGATAADLATAVRALINGKTRLPVTASGSSGAVTITAKGYGTRWGTGSYATVRISVNTPGAGITISGGGDLGATTAGADGATTAAAQLATALLSIPSTRRYYVVYGDAHGSTACTSLRQFIANSAVAKQGRRMQLITGSRHTKSAVTAVAVAANYERQIIAHQAGSYWTPECLAAQLAATMQGKQEGDASYGFVDYSGPDWAVPEAPEASQPTGDDISDLIGDGVSTIASKPGGGSYLPMLVNTRSKDGSGTYDDFRCTEGHRISAADFVVDDMEPKLAQFKGQKIGTRPKLPSGAPDMNYVFPKGTIDSYVTRATYVSALKQWENIHLQRLDETLASLSIVRAPGTASAFLAQFTLYAVDICTQMQNDINEGSRA